MVHVLIKHKVKDYDKWKSVFDEHSDSRKAGGEKGARLFHNVDKPNDIVIILEWDSIENAKKFYESDDLKKVMKDAGVLMKPYIYFLEEVKTV
jgi:quinol monooxygenase YgiN